MSDLPNSPEIIIVYSDEYVVVVNKPAGLLCVPGLSIPDNLYDRVKHHYPSALIVHRLDMATSGLVIFALNTEVQRALGKAFEKRLVRKHYIAIVNGTLEASSGEIHCPVICDWPNRPKQKVDWLHGKMGITFFKTLERNPTQNSSRLKLMPHTGRTHQLRVHMWNFGYPILGDEFYNTKGSELQSSRLLLHAEHLDLPHPVTQRPLLLNSQSPF